MNINSFLSGNVIVTIMRVVHFPATTAEVSAFLDGLVVPVTPILKMPHPFAI